MNARTFSEMTGKRLYTSLQSATLWHKRETELRARLAGLPQAEAVLLCRKLIASEVAGDRIKIACINYLDKSNII